MPNSIAGSAQARSAMESATPTDIIPNFNKGLMQVRSSLVAAVLPEAPPVPPVIIRTEIYSPKLGLLPEATVAPGSGLLLSACFHTAMAAALLSVPILVPTRLMNVRGVEPEFDTQVVYRPLLLPVLPPLAEAAPETGPSSNPEIALGGKPRSITFAPDALAAVDPPTPKKLRPDYAGAQKIVSNPPHATKGVQTIVRPDLITPPKLNFPVRLPSIVLLPAQAIRPPLQAKLERPKLEQPKLEQPKPPKLKEVMTLRASESPVQVPVRPKLGNFSTVRPEAVISKTVPASEPSFAAAAPPKTIVVINAVSVPPEPAPPIPDAELSSQFVVAPSTEARAENPAGGSVDRHITSGNALNTAKDLSHMKPENGAEDIAPLVPEAKGSAAPERTGAHGNVANSGSRSNTAARPGLGDSSPASAAKAPMPGISISGGSSGRSGSGRAAAMDPTPRGSYGLTVISGGSSGGASRDLGVFLRSDTVYSVYIPMTDAGGGPAWPMQYALASPAPRSNGLLAPPIVAKKIPVTKLGVNANSGPVFVTGIIDENGKFQALRAVRALDGRAQSAIEALTQWEFLPAQLDGKPVPCKVLIGVSVMPAEEVGQPH